MSYWCLSNTIYNNDRSNNSVNRLFLQLKCPLQGLQRVLITQIKAHLDEYSVYIATLKLLRYLSNETLQQ